MSLSCAHQHSASQSLAPQGAPDDSSEKRRSFSLRPHERRAGLDRPEGAPFGKRVSYLSRSRGDLFVARFIQSWVWNWALRPREFAVHLPLTVSAKYDSWHFGPLTSPAASPDSGLTRLRRLRGPRKTNNLRAFNHGGRSESRRLCHSLFKRRKWLQYRALRIFSAIALGFKTCLNFGQRPSNRNLKSDGGCNRQVARPRNQLLVDKKRLGGCSR
jgi:hypothetical protein